jgi:hypothetical protein
MLAQNKQYKELFENQVYKMVYKAAGTNCNFI